MRRPKREDIPYFNGSESSIDIEDLVPGCARPDCIPSLDNPNWLDSPEGYSSNEEVIALFYEDDVFAVSKFVLNVHEIVNFEHEDGTPLAITYCPLCQTEKGYLRLIEEEVVELGVSGLLWNSALVLYDRKSLSLFSQAISKCILGKYNGARLIEFPVIDTTVEKLMNEIGGIIRFLSKDTGSRRAKNYSSNPYGDYENTDTVYFPLKHTDNALPKKERVFVLREMIIPQDSITSDPCPVKGSIFSAKVAGFPVFFRGNPVQFLGGSLRKFVADNSLEWIPADYCFYFTARAYHPKFGIYRPRC